MHVCTGDLVEVISGANRGVRGKVLMVDHESNKAVVEGVNRVYKHVRRSQKNPQGGRLSKEMPVWLSNLKLICESCKQSSRTGVRYQPNGGKERFCKKCGEGVGQISAPKATYTKI